MVAQFCFHKNIFNYSVRIECKHEYIQIIQIVADTGEPISNYKFRKMNFPHVSNNVIGKLVAMRRLWLRSLYLFVLNDEYVFIN